MRVADYIVQKLKDYSIRDYHIVTGRGALFINDGVARENDVATTFYHHEQSAGFAAMGQTQVDLVPSVCMCSTGCASTNVITPVLCAWQDYIPMIVISGNNQSYETTRHTGAPIRTYGQQEADIIQMVEGITKYAVMVSDPAEIRYHLEKAIHLAMSDRKGPVWLDIPLDVQNMRVSPEELKKFELADTREENEVSLPDVRYVCVELEKSTRPCIMIGSGIKQQNAVTELKNLVEKNNIPMIFTHTATDTYGSKNQLSIGSISSMGGSRAAAFTLQNSDLVIVLGSRLNSITTGPDFCSFAPNAKIIVIDIDTIEHQKEGVEYDRLLQTNLKDFLVKMNAESLTIETSAWVEKCLHWKKLFSDSEYYPIGNEPDRIDVYEVAHFLSDHLPSECSLVCDSGFIDVIMPTNVQLADGQRCYHPASQGAMGYALPAGIGIVKKTESATLVFVGDGSIMMNLQELQTVSENNLPLKVFVLNNDVYGIIRRRQKDLFRKRQIGVDESTGVSCPDFKDLAQAFNFSYNNITSLPELERQFVSIVSSPNPEICEIMTNTEQDYIEIGYMKDETRKISRRPIEDQKPFMSREIYNREMLKH